MAKSNQEENGKWMNLIGLSLLLVCYVGAIWNVISNKRDEQRADVIRLVHWQLELGVRQGVDALIEEFEAFKAAQGQVVEVKQIPIPERAYNQYVTTQLIGGTAPDMIQIGQFPREYLGRYFYPLSKSIQRPNPMLDVRIHELKSKMEPLTEEEVAELANLEELRELPWMDNFNDGLRGQFNNEFQEYFGVGFSTFTVRMYYNKDIFRQVLGHDRPPASFQEFVQFSEAIAAYAEENEIELLPIASSKYQVNVFKERALGWTTASLVRDYDLDLSGNAEGVEKLMAMLRGDLTPWNPEYKAALDAVQEIARFFPRGFMAMGREDSGFSFVQGKAGMITSGSWDALSYLKNIQDQPEDQRFEVGIFDLPSIASTHPVYGKYADGRITESTAGTGFAFGITRFTRNYDLCVEFLQFATTPHMNTRVNQIAGWIPVVQGAVPTDWLKNFEPNFVGYNGQTSLIVAEEGKARLLEDQIYWPYVSGKFDYETYAQKIWEDLPTAAATDYARMYQGSQESIPNRQLRRSAYLANVVFGPQDEASRTRAEIQLQRSLQPLLRYQLDQKVMDRMMELTMEQVPDDERIRKFNETFKRALEREMGN